MFDRFIRLAKARKALSEGRYEDAVHLADDPVIREDRRAEELRQAAQRALAARGKDKLAQGDAAAAVRDLQRAAGLAPGSGTDETATMLAEARRQVDALGARKTQDQRSLDEARRLAERGQLAAARALLAAAGTDPALAASVRALQAFVEARLQEAGQHRQRAADLLAAGRIDGAIEAWRTAVAVDVDMPANLAARIAAAAGERLDAVVAEHVQAGDLGAALAAYRQRSSSLPDLAAHPRVAAVGARLAAVLKQSLQAMPAPDTAADLLQGAAQDPALPGADGSDLQVATQALLRLPQLRAAGRSTEVAAALAEAGERLGHRGLQDQARDLARRIGEAGRSIETARAAAASGELALARQQLVAILQELPLHDEARAELAAIDMSAREREQRLQVAREAAKAGRLREAYAQALAQALPGPAGDDARLFAQELQARLEVVGRGLDQVRASLHGRTSGAPAGLRHCLLRVEELAKVQSDHPDVPQLRAALTAEIAGIEQAEAAIAALGRAQPQLAANAVAALVAQRDRLLQPDRLDARILDIADRLWQLAESALAAGRLAEAERCLQGPLAAVVVRPEYADRCAALRADCDRRRERAEALASEAAALLQQRDLTGAEQKCEAARQLWVDSAAVRRVEDELQSLRQQQARLDRAEAMASGGDLEGAQAELGELPVTPALLRTRIFDMRQNLARAQGLDGAFLLRVDEGGEYVAVRGETVTIGNLRDGRSDLPILAAIAGRHARIQRSMSFHGGMQDTLIAEAGEVRVGGVRKDSHKLSAGDRVWLGSSLQVGYELPSKRSLTAALRLFAGFQVAGTDRVLLFKDRGRDGRILIGPGEDVHVRVAGAKGEVEVFAHKTGQMRVRCELGGEIDGRPFRDEHPVDAGATVQAAGVSFVLLPWVRG